MAANPPAKLSHRHEAVLRAILENPEVRLRDIARLLGYTQAWLSTIIHSDAFQAELARRREDLWHESKLTIREKLEGLAHAGLERMAECLDGDDVSLAQARDATSMVLESLGYTPKGNSHGGGGGNVLQVSFSAVSPEVYIRARERLLQRTERVPALESSAEVGTAGEGAVLLPQPHQGERGEGPGATVREEGERALAGDFQR